MKAPSAAPRTRMVRITRLLGVPLPPCRVAGRGTGSSRPSLARRLRAPQAARRSGAARRRPLAERPAHRVGERPDDDRLEAVDSGGLASPRAWHERAGEPEPCGLAEAPVDP